MRRKIVAGNWKMNGSRASAQALLDAIVAGMGQPAAEVLICPPSTLLAELAARYASSGLVFGGQDVSPHEEGAYTGEISARMWIDAGARYVLVGHSERRQYQGESSELVAQKFMAARRAGLIPVLCVGETLTQREAGQTEYVVQQQLEPVLRSGGPAAFENALLAYEPVWAIGTGKTATPEQAQDVHAFIRSEVASYDANIAGLLPILYGGSVKGANAAELFSQPDVDGGLVGGASLLADDFLKIIAAA
ncbi:triose-phosphate isomerase [Pseudomarimonas arenosa]|uniref:Triosephosphate isomerase n=1 Tax=Pseudomarimonas arenosa TaxID=2774145 RepID=A0AAW3ZMW3_9GAMM|nr:triose-phosphate isomerase [Pseudomarimonas arenosa]MBD8526835.1 triose-phosphate isomerase [Pseudomarimonas arenosa]